jgi:hypothetical protein
MTSACCADEDKAMTRRSIPVSTDTNRRIDLSDEVR